MTIFMREWYLPPQIHFIPMNLKYLPQIIYSVRYRVQYIYECFAKPGLLAHSKGQHGTRK